MPDIPFKLSGWIQQGSVSIFGSGRVASDTIGCSSSQVATRAPRESACSAGLGFCRLRSVVLSLSKKLCETNLIQQVTNTGNGGVRFHRNIRCNLGVKLRIDSRRGGNTFVAAIQWISRCQVGVSVLRSNVTGSDLCMCMWRLENMTHGHGHPRTFVAGQHSRFSPAGRRFQCRGGALAHHDDDVGRTGIVLEEAVSEKRVEVPAPIGNDSADSTTFVRSG